MFKGKGKAKQDSGTSTLTELTETSPSLGGGKSLMGSSPIRRLKELAVSDAANLSARSDGGVTHVSGSVEDPNGDSSEEERLRRVQKYQKTAVDQDSDSDHLGPGQFFFTNHLQVTSPKRRVSELGRRQGQSSGASRRLSSPIKASSSVKSSQQRTSVGVTPPKTKHRTLSFPETSGNTSPGRARLVKAVVAGNSSAKPQQVYVLLPEPSSAWTSALMQGTSEGSSIAPSEDYSMEVPNLEHPFATSLLIESESEQSEEPPSKRARASTSGSSATRQTKGKAKDASCESSVTLVQI
jgi:hypothetical protein